MTSEYRPEEDYADLLGGQTNQAFFAGLQDMPPPDGLTPLPFSPELATRLDQPIIHALDFPRVRRGVVHELTAMVAQPALALDADENTVQDVRFGLSEAVQNSFRNGNGVHDIAIRRTPTGGLYMAISNIAVDYPTGPVLHNRLGQRPLRLDGNRARRRAMELAEDEHGWGLGLIGTFALRGDGAGMGFYTQRIAAIPKISTGSTVEITRLVFWSVYARARAADMPLVA